VVAHSRVRKCDHLISMIAEDIGLEQYKLLDKWIRPEQMNSFRFSHQGHVRKCQAMSRLMANCVLPMCKWLYSCFCFSEAQRQAMLALLWLKLLGRYVRLVVVNQHSSISMDIMQLPLMSWLHDS
jgi:hypothetical protein